MSAFTDWWDMQEAGRKKTYIIVAAVVVIGALSYMGGKDRQPSAKREIAEKPDTTFLADDGGEADIAELNAKDTVQERKIQQLERSNQELAQRLQRTQSAVQAYTGLNENPEQLAALVDEVNRLRNDYQTLRESVDSGEVRRGNAPVSLLPGVTPQGQESPSDGGSAVVADPFSDSPPDTGEPVSQYLDPLNKIKGVLGSENKGGPDNGQSRFGIMGDAEFNEEAPQILIGDQSTSTDSRGKKRTAGSRSSQTTRDRRTEDAEEEQDTVYLPSGSLVRGVLLNGMDAPTGQGATSDPYPVTIRVTSLAFLPNKFTTNIRECFILAAGIGRLDMERVILRTERLSCVTTANSVIDVSLDGYVSGEDGKVGLRGTVVERTGALVARAALAGLGSGLATALQPQVRRSVQTGDEAGGIGFDRPPTDEVLEVGAYAGAANAMQMIADYYLERAEQIFPVIELDALRPVVVHLTKGTELKLKENAYNAQMAKSE